MKNINTNSNTIYHYDKFALQRHTALAPTTVQKAIINNFQKKMNNHHNIVSLFVVKVILASIK